MAIHLVVPGLGEQPGQLTLKENTPPVLRRFMAKADLLPGGLAYAETLFQLFEMQVKPGGGLSTGALAYLADVGEPSDQYIFQADPIHLYPDQDRLLVFDTYHSEILEEEAAALVQAFNQHFSSDGLMLLAPHPKRWYLSVKKPPDLQTSSLEDVLGRNMDMFLPKGMDEKFWLSLLNEVQMLFYSHDVNQEREISGQLMINGIWLSGGGYLPQGKVRSPTHVIGDDVLLKGLARLAGNSVSELDAFRQIQDDSLVVIKKLWRSLLDKDEQARLAVMIEIGSLLSLAKDTGRAIYLHTCGNGTYHYLPRHKYRFWR